MAYGGDRNYGCRFLEISIYGMRSIILENEKIRVTLVLDKSTEIIEFNYKPADTDFVWRSPQGLSCMKRTLNIRKDQQYFQDNYTGGWFEAFPNIGGACSYRGADIPEYGEVCYLPWEYIVLRDDPEEVAVKCYVKTIKTPFLVKKVFTVKTNTPVLFLEEKVTNLSSEDIEYQWGFHPNMGAPFLDENCVVDIIDADVNVYADIRNSRVKGGEKGKWPVLRGRDGMYVDLSKMPAPGSKIIDLLFISNMSGSWAAARNEKTGLGIGYSWDPEAFNSCVVWMSGNGDSGYPRYGNTYVLCIMPKNADIHTLSEGIKHGSCTCLPGGGVKNTWLTISVLNCKGKIKSIDRKGNASTIGL